MIYGCRGGLPHALRVEETHPDAYVELCHICGHKEVYYRTESGSLYHPEKYIRDHVRDTCQPYGPTSDVFEMVYGRERLEAIRKKDRERKTKEQKAKEMELVRQDAKKSLSRQII